MTVTETLSAAVFGTALVAMRMLRGLMWILAIAVVACVATTAMDDASRVAPLGATGEKLTAPVGAWMK